jgi:hypothetical protein
MTPPLVSEQLDDELELLSSMYDDTSLAVLDETTPITIHLNAQPQTAADPRIFCGVVVAAELPPSYPSAPAKFILSKPRGLDDAQLADLNLKLNRLSNRAADEKQVHVSLGFQEVIDWLSSRNVPDRCSICMEDFDLNVRRGEKTCVMLEPCLHCIHAGACYAEYYATCLRNRREREASLRLIHGTAEAERLAAVNWPPCPVCRTPFLETNAKTAAKAAHATANRAS